MLGAVNFAHEGNPALEDGTDRGFRNVGIQQSDAGETPKRIHNKGKGNLIYYEIFAEIILTKYVRNIIQ